MDVVEAEGAVESLKRVEFRVSNLRPGATQSCIVVAARSNVHGSFGYLDWPDGRRAGGAGRSSLPELGEDRLYLVVELRDRLVGIHVSVPPSIKILDSSGFATAKVGRFG